MLTSRGLGRVLGDLAAMGYDAQWGVLGADDVGAPHERERIWILANADKARWKGQREPISDFAEISKTWSRVSGLANANGGRCGRAENWEMEQQRRTEVVGASAHMDNSANQWDVRGVWGMGEAQAGDNHRGGAQDGRGEWWAIEPAVGRVAHGVANRVDRLAAIGNGQVPAVAATAFRMLAGRFGVTT